MARQRSPDRLEAERLYLESNGKLKLIEIAEKLNRPEGTIRGWKKKDKWDEKLNGTFQKEKKNNTERSKRRKGGQPGNKNAVGNSGGAAPVGNLNALKHGAYQSLYVDMLSDEEKVLYEQTTAEVNIDEEIKLLRLKIARLLNREWTFFYSPFGDRIERQVSEEDRINGINACMDQLRKLIEAKAKITHDSEKLQIEKEKFEFDKYKADIELKLKQEKLELEKTKITGDEGEIEDDGFLDALSKEAKKVWNDNEN